MTGAVCVRLIGVAAFTVLASLPVAAQSVVGPGKTGPVPDPVPLETEGMFQAKFARVGDDFGVLAELLECVHK